jgi:hypothetical protein
LERWLEIELPARFQRRILPIDSKIADSVGFNGRIVPNEGHRFVDSSMG